MFKLCFSTVACPNHTLEAALSLAVASGYDGLELRTLGPNDPSLLCEPALTGATKIRRLAVASGVELASLSTSLRFDAPIWPPVLGRALPGFAQRSRPAQRAVDFADDMECELVRVFGFEASGGERRTSAVKRIGQGLRPVLDTARARRVNVAIENGGTFTRAEHLAEIFRACEQHPNLRAAYDATLGQAAGEDLQRALETLGDRLSLVRVRPVDAEGHPTPLTPVSARQIGETLSAGGYDGWVSIEWPAAWSPEIVERHGSVERVLSDAASALRVSMPQGVGSVASARVAVGV